MEYNSSSSSHISPFFTATIILIYCGNFPCWEKLQIWEMLQQLFWCLVSCKHGFFIVFIVRLFCDAILLEYFEFFRLGKEKVSNVPMELKIYPHDSRCGANRSIFSFRSRWLKCDTLFCTFYRIMLALIHLIYDV